MRIVVNRELCESNGVCVRVAADMFAIDETDQLKLLVVHPAPAQLEKAQTAVRKCPRGALSLVED